LNYAGRADARAAIESVVWAASRGDVEHLAELLGFAPDVRPLAEAMFAQLPAASREEYGSPEKVVATLMAGSFPKDAASLTLFDGRTWGQDATVSMTVGHADGRSRTNTYLFHRSEDGWQLMVPASVLAGYAKTLTGAQQPPEAAPP